MLCYSCVSTIVPMVGMFSHVLVNVGVDAVVVLSELVAFQIDKGERSETRCYKVLRSVPRVLINGFQVPV